MRPSAAILALVVAVSLSGDVAYAQRARQETGGEPYRGTGGVRYMNSRVAAAGVDSEIAAVTANWYRQKWKAAATTTTAPPQQPPPSRLMQPLSHPVKVKLDDSPPHKKRPKPDKKVDKDHHKRRHHHGEYIQHAKKLQALTAGSSEYRAIQEGSYFDNRTLQPVPPVNALTKDRLFDWERKRQQQQQRYWRTTSTTTQTPQAWAAREGYVGAPSTRRPDDVEQVRRNRAWAEYLARLSSSSSTDAPQPAVASSGSGRPGSSVAYHRGRRPAHHTVIHNSEDGVSYAAGSYFAHRTSSSGSRLASSAGNQRRNRVTSTTASPTTTTVATTTTTTAATWQPHDYEDEDYNYNSNNNNNNNEKDNNNRNRHFEDEYDESVHPLERLLRG